MAPGPAVRTRIANCAGGPRWCVLTRRIGRDEARSGRGGGDRRASLARLLGLAGRSDVIDAAVVLLAADDDYILTSDRDDLVALAAASGRQVEIVPV